MNKMRVLKFTLAATLSVACCFAFAGCQQKQEETTATSVYDTSEGVAATVNGTEIGEKIVSEYIANYRSAASLTSDADWAQWMVDNDYTASDLRESVINYYVSQELIRQAAKENNISVESSEIDEQVATMRAYYDSDEDWQSALAQIGTTEAQYRDLLEISMLQQKIQEQVITVEDPTDEELLQYAQMYATYYNGAKKSSHILFSSDDESTAQEVLDKINSGELDFAEAAKQYSTDTSSAEDGGNVGWDKLTSFVDEYQDALDQLEKDQVSGLVTSSYGIHIIKCTDVFTAPDEVTSTDQLPSEFMDSIKETLASYNEQNAYSEWYSNYKENADIVINDMPSGLAYDVSTEGLTASSSSDSSSTSTTTSTDSSTTDSTSTSTDSSSTTTDSSSASSDSSSTSTSTSSDSSSSSSSTTSTTSN